MSGAIASRAIAGSALGGDDDWEVDAETQRYRKRRRVTAITNKYLGVGDEPAPAPAPIPTPTYDALPAEKKAAVDSLVVAVRMTQPKGDV